MSPKLMNIHENALLELQGLQGSGQDSGVAAEMHVFPTRLTAGPFLHFQHG